jgi:hypothetical protein
MTASTSLYDSRGATATAGSIANLNRPTSSNLSSRPQRSRRSSPSGRPCSPRCAHTDTLGNGIGCLIREIGSRGQGCQGPAPERRLRWRRCCCPYLWCRRCCGRRRRCRTCGRGEEGRGYVRSTTTTMRHRAEANTTTEKEESDEDMGFGLFD